MKRRARIRAVKVGFRSLNCHVHLRVPQSTEQPRLAALRKQTEASCATLDTLSSGVPIAVDFAVEIADEPSSSPSSCVKRARPQNLGTCPQDMSPMDAWRFGASMCRLCSPRFLLHD